MSSILLSDVTLFLFSTVFGLAVGWLYTSVTWGVFIRFWTRKEHESEGKKKKYNQLILIATTVFTINYIFFIIIINHTELIEYFLLQQKQDFFIRLFALFWITNILIQTPFINKTLKFGYLKSFGFANISYFLICLVFPLITLGTAWILG